ncbi:MAG: hypothetical protein MN733_18310 [Nitrososphaera sp.]|nr:hypothetical protein [Nitrososphaera sp.]
MGDLERRGDTRKKKRDLQRALLMTVQIAGLLALAAVPSNLPIALHKMGMLPTGPQDSGSVNRARNILLHKGLLMRNRDGFLRLTSAGKAYLDRLEMRERLLHPRRRWDGRWRVLIFDIPEKRKHLREHIRNSLRAVGFARLQDSVWTFPYDCEEFVALLKADFKIGKDMIYMIVDEMESDGTLKKQFGLS